MYVHLLTSDQYASLLHRPKGHIAQEGEQTFSILSHLALVLLIVLVPLEESLPHVPG